MKPIQSNWDELMISDSDSIQRAADRNYGALGHPDEPELSNDDNYADLPSYPNLTISKRVYSDGVNFIPLLCKGC